MPKTEVLLIHNVIGLGGESDLVKISTGYARNYLIPQGLAVPVSLGNKRRVEALRLQIEHKLAEIYAQEDAIEMYLGGATQAEEALGAFCRARDYYVETYRLADLQ